MPLYVVASDSDFNSKFAENRLKTIIIDFTASWCGPCQYIAPIFEELANQYKGSTFLKVDVDVCSGTASTYGVNAMPTFMVIVNGEQKQTIQGADELGLRNMVRKYASTNSAWSGTGQRLSSQGSSQYAPTASTPRPQELAAGFERIDNQVFDLFRSINDRLHGLGINDIHFQGYRIQPFHLLVAIVSFVLMGPFGLLMTAAIVIFTQSGNEQPQTASPTNPQRPSSSTTPAKPAFHGSGQRLGGN